MRDVSNVPSPPGGSDADMPENSGKPSPRTDLGYSPTGDPLSVNRAPPAELSPWLARIYATKMELSSDAVISCGLLTDTPILRVLFGGEWLAETRDGQRKFGPSALLFGPQSRRMPVQTSSSFGTIGVCLKPGAVEALNGPKVEETLDQIINYDDIYSIKEWGSSQKIGEWFDPDGPVERWLRIAEILAGQLIELTGGKRPDPVIEAFDKAVLANPNLNIGAFIEAHNIERRRFERLIKRAFGQNATKVLRRARALDLAAHLRGVADDDEAAEAALRFCDQSHMIREFRAFLGMTPRQFARTPQPFLTLNLEARQARRLEVLGRAEPGQPPPWRN